MYWWRPFLLTLQLMGCAVLLAAAIGIPLAFCIGMISRRSWCGRASVIYCMGILIACVATPMILHATAWEATAGKFGWMTFSPTASRTYTGLGGQYSGLVAAAWIHGLHGAAIVALVVWFGTSTVSRDVIEQSLMDTGPVKAWWRIRLPIAWPWMNLALLATGILAATEMTVVDLYGVRTIADEFYLFHASDPSITSILMMLVLPVVLAIAAVILVATTRVRRHQISLVGYRRNDRAKYLSSIESEWSDRRTRFAHQLLVVVAIVVSSLMFVLPFSSLVIVIGQQIVVSNDSASMQWSLSKACSAILSAPMEYHREYLWTAILASSTATVSVLVGWILASAVRKRKGVRLTVDFCTFGLFLIPGPIVGLVLVRTFSSSVPGFHTLYHQTIIPTICALSVRAIPLSYWTVRAGYAGIRDSVMDIAEIDLSWTRRMWAIDRPLLARPLAIAWCGTAILASGDVPVTLPILPPGVVTVGTRLFALLHSGARNQEAALAFWYILAIILLGIAFSSRWKRASG